MIMPDISLVAGRDRNTREIFCDCEISFISFSAYSLCTTNFADSFSCNRYHCVNAVLRSNMGNVLIFQYESYVLHHNKKL